MTTAKILTTIVILGISATVHAQTALRASTVPETFTATAHAKNAKGGVSGTLELLVKRYTPDFDRKTVEEALRLGGYPRFLTALRNAPDVGYVVLGGGQPYVIRYARETVESGGRIIVLVTDRPVLFLGSSRADAKPRAGFEVGLLRLQVDANGTGSGTMAAAARVRPDGDGGVLLDDYADMPIELANVTRQPSSPQWR